MDSPTRRQLVVGFLEPAEKNDNSAEKPSDWMISAAIHVAAQSHFRRFLFTEDVHALNSQEGTLSTFSASNDKDLFTARLRCDE